jgi:hypothetical protein
MAKLMSLGPVFGFEWLAVSRRWQWYAARSVFVLGILGALSLVWWARAARSPARTVQAQAVVGRVFCGAIIATQLAMVLLAAPAATAGALCLDRARGTLAHMLVTDLSSVEIILGKLAARMVPVLGILLCFLPIPALASLLGGIDPGVVAGSMVVTIGVAASGGAGAVNVGHENPRGLAHDLCRLVALASGSSHVVGLPHGARRRRPTNLARESESRLASRGAAVVAGLREHE